MRRTVGVVVLTAAGLLAAAAPAFADPGTATEPVGVLVRHDDGTQSRSIRISGLHPTATRQVVFLLDGEAPREARRMVLAVEDLRDRENGCGRPETREGDTTCGSGDGDGELSSHLGVTLTAGTGDGDHCTPVPRTAVTTTLRALATEPAVVGLPDRDGLLCVVADIRHDDRPGDDVTQSDSSLFDLRMDLDGRTVPLAAGTGTGTGPDPLTGAAVTLRPATFERGDAVELGATGTGFSVGLAMLIGGGALGGCAALLVLGRRRLTGMFS